MAEPRVSPSNNCQDFVPFFLIIPNKWLHSRSQVYYDPILSQVDGLSLPISAPPPTCRFKVCCHNPCFSPLSVETSLRVANYKDNEEATSTKYPFFLRTKSPSSKIKGTQPSSTQGCSQIGSLKIFAVRLQPNHALVLHSG